MSDSNLHDDPVYTGKPPSVSISFYFGFLTVIAGLLVLAGWLFDIPCLKGVFPGYVTMKANTALGFASLGMSLMLLARSNPSLMAQRLSQVFAGATALLGLVTICQYLLGVNLGIDQLLFTEPANTVGTLSPGRMAPNSAISFILLGCALFMVSSGRGIRSVQVLALLAGLIGLAPLIDYLYGATAFIGFGYYMQMAVHTAVIFIIVSIGVILLRPAEGLMQIVTSNTMGGWLIRHLLPLLVGVPILLGWFRVQGERYGHFESTLGVSLMMICMMILFTGLVCWTANALNRIDAERHRSESRLRETNEYLDNLFNYANAPIIVWDPQFRITRFNHAFEFLAGRKADEVIGRPLEILFPSSLVDGSMALIRKTQTGERWETVEINIRHRDGSVRTVLWNSATLFTPDGKTPVSTIAQGQDITERKRAEEALRKSEEQFRMIVEGVTDYAIIMLDPQGRVVSWNTGAERLKGYRAEEIIGQHFARFYTEEDVACAKPEQELATAAVAGRFEDEGWRMRKDGARFWANVIITALHDEAGRLRGFAKITRDITERKKMEVALRESERLYRGIGESIDYGVWVCAPDGRNIYASESFLRLVGITQEQCSNFGWGDVLHPEDSGRTIAAWKECVRTGEVWNIEHRFRGVDGKWHPVLARGVPVRNEKGQITCWAGINLDISQIKQAEEDLRRSLSELGRSNKELEQFAYVASHDLQEPLRMVASYTQLLAQRYEGQLDEKARKYIDYAVNGAVRMQRLINDLLAFSRINTKGASPELTDSHSVLGEAIKNLSSSIEESQSIITNDELPMVRVDPSQLMLLFQNLISNAIKFSGAHTPRIHVSARELGQEWCFSVKDSGIGIDMRYAEKIFVIFQRLHTMQEYPGTGIGLAICRRVVERHGGRIWFESELNQGSTFYFTLPK
ncbi:MAG: PAS domain S-box protein [Victivallales bacterium]